jgi:hypothetical protein
VAKFEFEDLEVKDRTERERPTLVIRAGSGTVRQATFVDDESARIVADIFKDTQRRLAAAGA